MSQWIGRRRLKVRRGAGWNAEGRPERGGVLKDQLGVWAKVGDKIVVSRDERGNAGGLGLGDDAAVFGTTVETRKMSGAVTRGVYGGIVQEDPGGSLMAKVPRRISDPVVLGFDRGHDPELNPGVEVGADHGDPLGREDGIVGRRVVPRLDGFYKVRQDVRIDGNQATHKSCSGAAQRLNRLVRLSRR